MLIQGTVGAQTNSDGSIPSAGARMGKQGDLIASNLHGEFYEQTYRGNYPAATSGAASGSSASCFPLRKATLCFPKSSIVSRPQSKQSYCPLAERGCF